ncbi:hypothetical protein X777_04342 [Ooceraea biroi]|uniref:Uncharacterized protein n=1 Tax=Ooceraea biroi TaxID=2015173 RepID=A0A026WH42_OOCBI|nr:hypothetical protein X777_04342 [Ooceraea biroi]
MRIESILNSSWIYTSTGVELLQSHLRETKRVICKTRGNDISDISSLVSLFRMKLAISIMYQSTKGTRTILIGIDCDNSRQGSCSQLAPCLNVIIPEVSYNQLILSV